MKTLLTAIFFAGTLMTAQAQIKTPAPSPSTKITQTVGLTDVTLEYSRPSVKDRVIFGEGGIVPYGEVWRTGANAVSRVTFSEDVNVSGTDLKAGKYAILTVPGAAEWAIQFYNFEGNGWSSYKEKEPAAIVNAKSVKSKSPVESFTISIGHLRDGSATMNISWANTNVPLKLNVHTDKQAMASIDKLLAGPTANDHYRIASFYHASGKELKKALEHINTATAGDDKKFWQVRRKALILGDLGMKKEAIEAAKLSLELAKKAENMDYVRMNEKSIKEWSK